MDRISVVGLDVYAHHGVLEAEQEEGQLFSIDVTLELDLSSAGRSDDLTDTVDYAELAGRIHERVSSERWKLIETVAHRVAALALEDPRVETAVVTVHKPQAPITVPFRDVTVTVSRSR